MGRVPLGESAPVPAARVPFLGVADDVGFPAEGGWEGAEALAPLVRAQDGGGVRAVTLVRVGRTAEALHVRFDCHGGVPPCTHVARGAPLWEESVVEAFLAAGDRPPARYLEIEVNPAAALFDAIVDNPDGGRRTMRLVQAGVPGVALRAGRPSPGRWTVEAAVRWQAIPGTGGMPGDLRANFYRIDRPAAGPPEFSAWSPTLADPPDFHKPSRFGLLILR